MGYHSTGLVPFLDLRDNRVDGRSTIQMGELPNFSGRGPVHHSSVHGAAVWNSKWRRPADWSKDAKVQQGKCSRVAAATIPELMRRASTVRYDEIR